MKRNKIFISIVALVFCLVLVACTPKCSHVYEEKERIESTCAVKGYIKKVCTNCQEEVKEDLPLLPHQFQENQRVESTCSVNGYILKKCINCKKETKETLPLLNHNFEESIIDSTCTESGYTLKKCIDCDHEEKSNFTDALNHLFGSWETITEATEVHDGLKKRSCIRCSHFEEEIIVSISYVDLDTIKESFNENEKYPCSTYEEVLLRFNCALLKNAKTLTCELNYEHESIQELINKLCADEHIPTAFHVKAQLAGNILTCSFTYNAKPELSGSYIFYEQYQSLNYHPITSSRPNNFDNFAINNSNYSYEVSTSDQLFYALERGVKPICVEGSNAEKVYQEMKKVLRAIITDNMTDAQKVIAIHDYIIMNVVYDEEVLQLLYQGIQNANCYNSFYLEGVFFDKKAVCEGISKAFASMCNVEGIPCVMVEGYPVANPQGAGHAWNKVYVDGDWYIVDTTSDGTIIDGAFEILSYKYCLIDDATHQKIYMPKTYEHITCQNNLNPYLFNTFEFENNVYDFNIESMDELEILIKYFETTAKEKTTIEFKIAYDYKNSCKDEINQAYKNCGLSPNYTFIDSEPIFMLIKGDNF